MGLFDKLFGKNLEIEINGKMYQVNEKSHFHFTNAIKIYNENLLEKSIEEINLSIKYFPTNPFPYFYKGYFLEDASKYDEAITSYEKSIELASKQLWILFRLAFCYQMKKDNRKALELYTICIDEFEEYNDQLINYSIN